MRLAALVLVLGLVGLAGCSSADEARDPDGATPTPSSTAPFDPSPEEERVDLAPTEVCGLVRDGVDAFNAGDVERTIEIFEGAVAPAEELAREQPSEQTRTLLAAVRYYASVPAEEYVEANATSPEFALYREFTLRECAYTGPSGPSAPEDTGIPA